MSIFSNSPEGFAFLTSLTGSIGLLSCFLGSKCFFSSFLDSIGFYPEINENNCSKFNSNPTTGMVKSQLVIT